MISLLTAFYSYLIFFGFIGFFRGWARELLVTFALIVALFLDTVILRILGLEAFFLTSDSLVQFSLRAVIFLALAFFGYQSPALSNILSNRSRREKLQDSLLGLVLGLLNGYLFIGTLWHYLAQAGYGIPGITPPSPDPWIIAWLPPLILNDTLLFVAVAVAFVFVLIVFV